MLATTDSGRSWKQYDVIDTQSHPFNAKAVIGYPPHFVNDSVGFVLKDNPDIVCKSTDGGRTWFVVDSLTTFLGDSLEIQFIDGTTYFHMLSETCGWIQTHVPHEDSPPFYRYDIYVTNDGCHSWKRVLQDTEYGRPQAFFLDSIHAWVAVNLSSDEGRYLRTTNCGSTWQIIMRGDNSFHGVIDTNGWNHTGVFIDSLRGMDQTVSGLFEFTTNGGSHWNLFLHQLDSPHVGRAGWKLFSDGTVLAFQSDTVKGVFFNLMGKTRDWGAHWERDTSPLIPSSPVDLVNPHLVAFIDTNIIVDNSQFLSTTTDGGRTWSGADSLGNFYIHDVLFLNRSHGFMLGTPKDNTLQWGFIETNDGGQHWRKRTDVPEVQGNMHVFQDHVITVCDSENVFCSVNGGRTFERIPTYPKTTGYFSDANFTDDNSGWLFSNLMGIWRTTDGGRDWQQQNQEDTCTDYFDGCNFFKASAVLAPSEVWIVFLKQDRSDYSLLHTTNGGSDWHSVHFTTILEGIDGMWFVTKMHGYVFGYGVVSETTDGGQTWFDSPAGASNSIRSLDSNFIWSGVGHSTDAGKTWSESACPGNLAWWPDKETTLIFGDAVGGAGRVSGIGHFGSFDTTAVRVRERQRDFIANSLSLTAYPNPSSNSTTISFALTNAASSPSPIKLVVYNMLGEAVLDLTSQIQQTGNTGEIRVHTSQLPIGIYVAQLRSGAEIQLQRLVITK